MASQFLSVCSKRGHAALVEHVNDADTDEVVWCRTQAKRSWTTAPTRIPVPPGTVVKRKRGGALLADLTHPGIGHNL